MVSSGSRSIQVQRRNNSKTVNEKSSGCAGNSTASNRNQLRKSYEASSTVPKLKTASVSERGSKLKPATPSLLKPSTPNYGRRTKTSPSFKKPLDSPLLTPLPPSPCSTPRLTPRSRRASNTSQVSKKSDISVISKNTDISTKKSDISIDSLKLKSRRKTTVLTSTRSKSIKMASNSSKDDGFGSFDTLRTSPGNRPITPQTPGKAKFSAKPRALDITKQISQTTSRVKFYKTGDCFSSALNIMVSAERYDSIDRLCSELTKSFDKQLMRGANSLPRGVRAIFQFDVLQIRAYDSETMENDKHDDNIQNLKIANINLNSSITSNSSKNSHTNSQTNSSKQGDSMLLTKIENLSQFKSNQTYLCTSSTAITSLDRKTVRQIAKNQGKPKNFNNQKTAQNLKFSSKTSSKTSSNKSNPRPTPTSVQQNSFFTRDIDINRDIIKPRHVFLLKPGRRPRTIKKFLLNTRTVHSFSQLLDDFSTTISLESGAVYHVYDQLTGEKVEKLEQFFGESRVFLVYGNRKSSAYNASDGTLDLTESGSIERQMGGGGGRGRSQVTKSTNLVKRTNSVGKFGENQLKVKNSDAVQKSKNYGRSRSVKSRGNGLKLKSKTRVKAKPARNSIFDDLPFELVKNLQIIRNIGVGNFAEVSIVRRISDNRELALKAIDKTKRLSNEHDIKAEAEILMSIKNKEHANIVYMHEFWEFEDRIFLQSVDNSVEKLFLKKTQFLNTLKNHSFYRQRALFLDYINGGDLFDMISRRKRFSERETVHMLKDLLRALRFLHSFNICHRDVKPENCLLYFSPNDVENGDILKSCLKITDFGLACQMKSTEDRLTMICGSPTYRMVREHFSEFYFCRLG